MSSSCDIASKGRKKGDLFFSLMSVPCENQNILMSFTVIGLSLPMIINSKEDSPEVVTTIYFFQCQRMKLYV